MGASCIITDSSIQFTNPVPHGNRNLKVLSHAICASSDGTLKTSELKVIDFPKYISPKFIPLIEPPSRDLIRNLLAENLSAYDDIFIILISKEISPLYEVVEGIVNTLHGHANIHLIDSQNTSLGLGLIIEYANELINASLSAAEVEKALRLMIPHVYTLLCTPNLSYLQAAGLLDKGQATIGEMLSLYPLFLIEEGKLNSIQKVKNQHAAVDYFIEFVDEFEHLKHVALLQPAHPGIPDTRLLHQHLDEYFPDTTYSEHSISPFLASMIGPRGFGMAVMEKI
jgi:uncharacterized protein